MKGQTPHPVLLEIPADLFKKDFETAKRLLCEREERIVLEKEDPIRYGYEPEHWSEVDEAAAKYRDILVLGGNRSGKSTWAGKYLMRLLVEKPDARAWCFQTTNDNSISMQQPILWDFMPAELRKAKRTQVTNISYTQKNGFSENTFVLPNRSQCWFRNYAQDIKTIEGGEVDVVWCDELVPLDWLETIRYRLVTRNGILIVTFTPVEGYSATVKEYLQGAKTLREIEAELLPKRNGKGFETVPTLQKCATRNAAIFYFHTQANPWAGYERMKVELSQQPREKILCRAYGVPTKATATSFPRFRESVHVVKADQIPKDGTVYLFCDPAGNKNWFMLWIRIDAGGRAWVYREWPQTDEYIEGVGYPEEWCKPSGKKADGEPGDGQKSFGFGLLAYTAEILRLEKLDGVEPFERWIDSRYGNTTVAGTREHATTLLEELEEAGMPFRSCPTENISEGVSLINDWLYYHDDKPIDHQNAPRLYISERCTNSIFALKEWTGADGQKGACKDPIDCLRYLVCSGVENVEGGKLDVTGGGSY